MKKEFQTSPLTKRLLKEMGLGLKLARLRRKLPMRLVAERAGISVNTLISLESGRPGVSIGALGNVLHVLGLAEDLSKISQDDILGRKLQDLELIPGKRAPKRKKLNQEQGNKQDG